MLLERASAIKRGPTPSEWLAGYEKAPQNVQKALLVARGVDRWTSSVQARWKGLNGNDLLMSPFDAFVSNVIWHVHGGLQLGYLETQTLGNLLQQMGLFRSERSPKKLRETFLKLRFGAPFALKSFFADPVVCERLIAHDSDMPTLPFCHAHHLMINSIDTVTAGTAFFGASFPLAQEAMKSEWQEAMKSARKDDDFCNPLHIAIENGRDDFGAWLATYLPRHRLNEPLAINSMSPLISAMHSSNPLPKTVAALLLRVPDTDLQIKFKGDTAAMLARKQSIHMKWLSGDLIGDLELKTQQFQDDYLTKAKAVVRESDQVFTNEPALVDMVFNYVSFPPKQQKLTSPVAPNAGVVATMVANDAPARSALVKSGTKRKRAPAATKNSAVKIVGAAAAAADAAVDVDDKNE